MSTTSNNSTAILFFSSREGKEATRKPLTHSAGFAVNSKVAKALINDTLRRANCSGLPVITCYGAEQDGTNFGDRLTHAIENTFSLGYRKVIVIGNDCPELQAPDIVNANSLLNDSDMVLGPDKRGGLYLIGLKVEHFDANTFKQLPWESRKLQESLRSTYCSDHSALHWLDCKADINSIEDLDIFLGSNPSSKLAMQLRRILNGSVRCCNPIESGNVSNAHLLWATLRGPPFLRFSFGH